MRPDIAIEVQNLSKKYTIGEKEPYLTFRDAVVNFAKWPGRFFLKKTKSKSEFWALKNVSFELKQGEIIGIIGKNGAGKSTLLKILSRITEPTKGQALLRGRVASLLEVGTGFNPELTGKENIFLNGSILGMTRREIKKKFDEIVGFSGVEKFLDTPVKRYSSGMYVRLAFSIAAYVEPDILLIDEVLAVGDQEFQKKCLGKMNEITKKAGRTIIFVSHNLEAIQHLCHRCIFLRRGKVEAIGKTDKVINEYLKSTCNLQNNGEVNLIKKTAGDKKNVYFSKIKIRDENGKINLIHKAKSNIIFDVEIYSSREQNCIIAIAIKDKLKNLLINLISTDYKKNIILKKGFNEIKVILKNNQLRKGAYYVSSWIGPALNKEPFDYLENCLSFQIDTSNLGYIKTVSLFIPDCKWFT